MVYPIDFQNLKESFQKLPGIGEKTAERFVYAIDSMNDDEVNEFEKNLVNYKKNIKRCNQCGHISDGDICNICSDSTRDKTTLCIVENSKDVFMFEKAGNYNGIYHILGGLISPIDEINPEDINISKLINERLSGEVKEIIIAINPSIEGETTSLYIRKLLEKKNIKISRLSYGIPMGSDIEYLDPIMISKALDDRKDIS